MIFLKNEEKLRDLKKFSPVAKKFYKKQTRLTKPEAMVNEIKKQVAINNIIADAIAKTKREVFVPSGMIANAYKLDALPISDKQFISSPLTVAKMTHYLMINHHVDSILEIGLGSGYQAAVLSRLSRRVVSIERIEKLLYKAKENFKKLNITNVIVKFDDGNLGWQKYAPYERILFSASLESPPLHLLSQLETNGVMVYPIQKSSNTQMIERIIKTSTGYKTQTLEPCEFVPVLQGTKKLS